MQTPDKIRFFHPGDDQITPLCHWFDQQLSQGYAPQESIILLPTQRACRCFMSVYLKIHCTKGAFLPQLLSMGNFEGLKSLLPLNVQASLPRPILPKLRRILLARLIVSGYQAQKRTTIPFGSAFKIAKELGEILDHNLKQCDLTCPPLASLAAHWFMNIDFLNIVTKAWTHMLDDMGYVDQGIYQSAIINALETSVEQSYKPILIAGSTGSQPLTRRLMQKIRYIPQGHVWLYTAHNTADHEEKLPAYHPTTFPYKTCIALKLHSPPPMILSKALFSLTSCYETCDTTQIKQHLEKVKILSNPDTAAEARCISTLTAHLLSRDDAPTLMIVCPDAALMYRIYLALEAEGIHPDYSLGVPVSQTQMGVLFLKVFQVLYTRDFSTDVVDIFQHPLTRFGSVHERLACIQTLERILRHPFTQRPQKIVDFKHPALGLLDKFLEHIPRFPNKETDMMTFLRLHKDAFLMLIGSNGEKIQSKDPNILQTFDVLLTLCKELEAMASFIPSVTGSHYEIFLSNYMGSQHVRPIGVQHPRLRMFDTREARLIPKDIVIMAGMNQGVWPRYHSYSPWVPRSFAEEMELLQGDMLSSLMGHDFLCHLNTPEVYLTFSHSRNGIQAMASSFIDRLQTLGKITNTPLEHRLPCAQKRNGIPSLSVPACRPTRPKKLTLTQIESLAKGYVTYEDILYGSKETLPYMPCPNIQEKGTLLHRFLKDATPLLFDGWEHPDQTSTHLKHALDSFLEPLPYHPTIHGLWRQQWYRALAWLSHTHASLEKPVKIFTEIEGALAYTPSRSFSKFLRQRVSSETMLEKQRISPIFKAFSRVVSEENIKPKNRENDREGVYNAHIEIHARMDRVDLMPDGTYHLWDYKTGALHKDITQALQLTFGSYMIHQGAFDALQKKEA